MNLKQKQHTLIFVISFLVLAGLAVMWTTTNYQQKTERYRAKLINELQTAYEVIVSSHQENARIVFNTVINQPEILTMYRRANTNDDTAQAELRRQLLAELGWLYERLKMRDVRQFHFHLPNNDSFLRFHRPEKYGDSLTGVRYSVKQANAQQVEVVGFEEGRIFNGFRNVFPLVYEGEHLGSVEISMGFDAIRLRMAQQFPHQYAFIIHRRVVDEKVFTAEQDNYQPSDLSDDYLYETGYTPSPELSTLNAALKPQLADPLQRGEPFVVSGSSPAADKLVVFLPVENVQGAVVAYIVSYHDDATLNDYFTEYVITLSGSQAGIFIIAFLFYQLLRHNRTLRAEKETLHQTTAWLNEAQRNARIGGYDIDLSTGNVVVSDSLTEIFKLPRQDNYTIEDLTNFIHSEDADEVLAHFRQCLAEQRDCTYEYRCLLPGGTALWVRSASVITYGPGGEPLRIVGTAQDITTHRQAEASLRESEARLRQAERLARLGHWKLDVRSTRLTWSDEIYRIFEIDTSAFGDSLESFLAMVHPDDRDAVEQAYRESVQNRTRYNIDHRILLPDGRIKFVHEQGETCYDADGQPLYSIGTVQDITARKQAEEALRASDANFRVLFENSPLGIYFAGPDGTILDANQTLITMLGSPSPAATRQINVLKYPPLQEVGYADIFRTCVQTGKTQFLEIPYTSKWGKTAYLSSYIVPLIDEKTGQTVKVFTLMNDVTERKELEERMVRQERLAAVGQLTAGIAHDFNNILTGILGYAELLQLSPEMPASARASLQTISQSGQRAATLVRQMLDFSRKTIHQLEPVNLSGLLIETFDFLKSTIPENIEMHLDLAAGDYLVEADATQLQQVITNLVLNARDAMAGGGVLGLGLTRADVAGEEKCVICGQPIEGEWVQLKVTDTGPGIPPEILGRVFEPFFTTKDVGQGTGLGLAQVYGIVPQHHGHILVESEVGQGSAFTIYLPPAVAPNQVVSVEAAQAKQGQGETILVVEDDPGVLEATGAMLRQLGYTVLAANSGTEALDHFEAHRQKIDLVLSDMVMPDMDGEELFQRLQAIDPSLKMIVMSGYPLGNRGADLLAGGVVDWLQKPVSFGQLSQAVAQALSDHPGRWR